MYTQAQMRRILLVLYLSLVIPCMLIFFSESMQQDLQLYWLVFAYMGEEFANFCLGHLGDISAPFTGGSGAGFLIFIHNIVRKKAEENAVYSALILGSSITSVNMIILESVMFFKESTNCGNSLYHCKADIGDILVFSIPIVTYIIWRFYHTK